MLAPGPGVELRAIGGGRSLQATRRSIHSESYARAGARSEIVRARHHACPKDMMRVPPKDITCAAPCVSERYVTPVNNESPSG